MKVKSIRPCGSADVFNVEVEDTHDFAVANGVIVHNCYDMLRYVCMRNPIAPRRYTREKIPEYDPLDFWKDKRTYDPYAFYTKKG